MRSGICASVSTTGWISVCVPSRLCGSGSCDRSSSAGVLMAPPAAMKCLALIVTKVPLGVRPSSRSASPTAPVILPSACCSWRTRSRCTSVAPWRSASGMVDTSIDCLALTGQPMPQ